MLVDKAHNRELALRLWEGKPSAGLLWSLDVDWSRCSPVVEDVGAFMQDALGCLLWGTWAPVAERRHPFVEIVEQVQGEDRLIEYRCEAGMLREVRRAGQILQHKVETVAELRVLVEMWWHLEVHSSLERYHRARDGGPAAAPVVVTTSDASAVQHLLQHETGVAGFWYLLADGTPLVEEAMALWQARLEEQYRIMVSLGEPRFYQAENTSTTMISPVYYERYSLGHIRQFTAAAHRCGARAVVHMCGLLRDLLPLLRRTEMDGIHLLTPPPVGDADFRAAFDIMPEGFTLMGRFGSLEWIGRTKEQMLNSLRRILPHEVYQEHAFLLMVTSDGAAFTPGDLERLREAVEEYEGEGT